VTKQRLAVVETERAIEPQHVTSKARRRFLDFAIDGRALYPDIRQRGLDCITPLWVDDDKARDAAVEAVRRLLTEIDGDAPDGRVTVYGCAECGDLGCGAATVRIKVGDDAITWSDWGWQTNYSDEVDRLQGMEDMTFDRAQYDETLRQAMRRLTDA